MSAPSDVPPSTLHIAGSTLTYLADGQGVPVVAFHGLPGSARDFRRIAAALPERRVRLIRINMPGFSGSAPLQPAGDWHALVELCARAAAELAGGPYVALGHSFGGTVALRVAARGDACGLALLAPAGLRVHRAVRMLGPSLGLRALRSSRLTRELFYRGLTATPVGVNASRQEADQTLALLSTLDFEPSRRAAHALRVPALASWCRDDSMVEPAIVEELLSALDVRTRLPFERGGHLPQRDHAPEIASALASFAEQCCGAAAADVRA